MSSARVRRYFPPSWSVQELPACFIIRDKLAHIHFEDKPVKQLTRDEAQLVAAHIAKLPELLCRPSDAGTLLGGVQFAQVAVDTETHQRYHETLNNLTPADVYLGRGQTILLNRKRIKRNTIQNRRLLHQNKAA